MESAFLLFFVLPPPAARPRIFAGLHRAGAGRAADRDEAARMQRIDRNVVGGNVGGEVSRRPIVDRVDLDERMGLVRPSRSQGRQRLYSQSDVNRLRHIQRLIQDLGVNLAGVEVVMHMNERMRQMEYEMQSLRQELQSYRDRILPVVAESEYER